MCFVLFALSPCVVKSALFGVVNVEYIKPTNKAKTSTQTSICQYSSAENIESSTEKATNFFLSVKPTDSTNNHLFVVRKIDIFDNFFACFLGNSPSKYILFKRLKLDIV